MKKVCLILLFAGNLFSQTTSAVWITQDDFDSLSVTYGEIITTGVGTWTLDVVSSVAAVEDELVDCQGDDLMFNYVSAQIQEIDRSTFSDRQASFYLIQSPAVLEAYQWMRKNRGNEYTIHQMVVRVNAWWKK